MVSDVARTHVSFRSTKSGVTVPVGGVSLSVVSHDAHMCIANACAASAIGR